MTLPPRISIIGAEISICDAARALDVLDEQLTRGSGGYVCFTNVHAAVMCRRNRRFRVVTNGSLLSVADGKPLFWAGKLKGASNLGHVPGPDFVRRALLRFRDRRHFFYGATPEVLARLVAVLPRQIPGLNICGALSPPFRALTSEEQQENYATIRRTNPDFIWVGLGAPKQELWMADAWRTLAPATLLGVGAAFDFHSGFLRRAPEGLRRVGLEWLHRLSQEPRRLWKRYLITNTLFVYYLLRDALIHQQGEETA